MLVAVLTLLSVAFYLAEWVRHMNSFGAGHYDHKGAMQFERNIVFWIAALAVFAGLLWLLSPILLPFVVGMALAYLLDPLANG